MSVRHYFSGFVVALALVAGASQLSLTSALSANALEQGVPSLAPMLKEVTPAVVSIRVTEMANAEQGLSFGGQLPEGLRRYFDFDQMPGRPEQQFMPRRQGAGSGVIINANDGLIVTNQHVVANADTISVTLKDGRNYPAELVGSDPGTDIALIKIDARDLVALPFADSENAEVGDFVVAIGNPFGIGQTVTSGIISALGRAGLDNEKYEDFIQTDAAINMGNSGGALVDMQGRLMGINTAIISANGGGSDGIGFAVPANMVHTVVDLLESDGEVRRGMLGVQISDITPEVADTLNLDAGRGALVASVMAGSAAEAAGIQVYDVIVSIDERAVENSRDLRNQVGLIRRGETVKLGILRDGHDLNLSATLGGSEELAQAESNGVRQSDADDFVGATLQSAGSAADGVEVVEVAPRSPAWQAGLRKGDLIVEVNRKAVNNLREFNSKLADTGDLVALTVQRDNRRLLVMVS
ncbi:MAG: Do family serine endopeptidase [Gammaproteobacteria bacterium]|nr:Do family serine endopeptidase [Pseudomonadales bacterium]MCP5345786.1 Do family serine endopeptidase [Pseudomonadales bacterium]